MSENKNTQHWSSEETSVLLAIWSSTEIQEKLGSTTRKRRVYDEISQEMLNGGFSRSTEQIENKLKKLRKEYRDLKRNPSRSGSGQINKTFDHEVMESVLEHRPTGHLTAALNTATAALERNADSVVFSVAELGSKISEPKTAQHWSSEETSTLIAIWSSTEIQEKLGSTKRKKRVYDNICQEMVNVGFTRTTDQIINKIKKLKHKREFRDNKKEKSKSGSQWSNKTINYDVMDSALERLPSSQFTEALNSATAMLEKNTDSVVFSVAELGSKISEPKTAQHWSSEETSALIAIWSSTEIQEKLGSTKRKKRVYDDICQEMVNVGFTRTTDQIINKIKKLKHKKEFRDNKKEKSKSGSQWSNKTINYDVMDSALERLPSSQFTEALNSATAMLETNTESLSSAADLNSSLEEVLDKAESSFSSTHPQPRKSLGTNRIRKKDSNQELLEYLKTADERFMAHAKELNTAILNKMDEATNSMLGLLGRMVAIMEEQQGNKP